MSNTFQVPDLFAEYRETATWFKPKALFELRSVDFARLALRFKGPWAKMSYAYGKLAATD